MSARTPAGCSPLAFSVLARPPWPACGSSARPASRPAFRPGPLRPVRRAFAPPAPARAWRSSAFGASAALRRRRGRLPAAASARHFGLRAIGRRRARRARRLRGRPARRRLSSAVGIGSASTGAGVGSGAATGVGNVDRSRLGRDNDRVDVLRRCVSAGFSASTVGLGLFAPVPRRLRRTTTAVSARASELLRRLCTVASGATAAVARLPARPVSEGWPFLACRVAGGAAGLSELFSTGASARSASSRERRVSVRGCRRRPAVVRSARAGSPAPAFGRSRRSVRSARSAARRARRLAGCRAGFRTRRVRPRGRSRAAGNRLRTHGPQGDRIRRYFLQGMFLIRREREHWGCKPRATRRREESLLIINRLDKWRAPRRALARHRLLAGRQELPGHASADRGRPHCAGAGRLIGIRACSTASTPKAVRRTRASSSPCRAASTPRSPPPCSRPRAMTSSA